MMRTTKKERKKWRAGTWSIETDDFQRLLDDADAVDIIAVAAGLPTNASAEEVVARVKELKWMVSTICTELFCNKEMPVPDALTISRIDGITRKRDPGPFDEALFAEETGRG